MATINLKSSDGIIKPVQVGFSWWNLIFGGFLPLYRKDWKQALIQFVCAGCTSGWTLIAFPFFYNNLNISFLLEKGYIAADENAELVLQKIEAEKAQWYKRPKLIIGGIVGIVFAISFASGFLTPAILNKATGGFTDRMVAVSNEKIGANSTATTASQILDASNPPAAKSNVELVDPSKSPVRGKWLYKTPSLSLSVMIVANGDHFDVSMATNNFKGHAEATGQTVQSNNGYMSFNFKEPGGKTGVGIMKMQGDKLSLNLQQPDDHGGIVSGDYILNRWVD
jgi:hypothetical protein